MKLEDAEPGMHVIYVPGHAHGDIEHPDVEHDVVTSKNDRFVFVRFKPWHEYGQACDPADLR